MTVCLGRVQDGTRHAGALRGFAGLTKGCARVLRTCGRVRVILGVCESSSGASVSVALSSAGRAGVRLVGEGGADDGCTGGNGSNVVDL